MPIREPGNRDDRLQRDSDSKRVADYLTEAFPERTWERAAADAVFDSPNEIVRIDEERGTVCRINVSAELRRLKIVWLLPQRAGVETLKPVFREAMLAVADQYGRSISDWTVEAVFTGHAAPDKAYRWQIEVPETIVFVRSPTSARIAIATFRQLLAKVETWV